MSNQRQSAPIATPVRSPASSSYMNHTTFRCASYQESQKQLVDDVQLFFLGPPGPFFT